jgi:hypothetical protein
MKRRELILLLGGASSGAMSVGTGAFSSVEAERNVEVDVVEDENAYLGLTRKDAADPVTVGKATKVATVQNQFTTSLNLSVTLKPSEHSVVTVTVGGHALNPGEEVNFTLDSPGDGVNISVTCNEPDKTSFELQFYGETGEASVDKVREFEINCKEPEDEEEEEEEE